LDLLSELGEVAKEILKSTNYGSRGPEYREEIKEELGDAFYSLINLANHYSVDLEEALALVLQKYEKRLSKGSAGSESA
jgi:NTP pyrophosphatase (non-canonical NTP hydrolase)